MDADQGKLDVESIKPVIEYCEMNEERKEFAFKMARQIYSNLIQVAKMKKVINIVEIWRKLLKRLLMKNLEDHGM